MRHRKGFHRRGEGRRREDREGGTGRSRNYIQNTLYEKRISFQYKNKNSEIKKKGGREGRRERGREGERKA